MKKGDVFKLLQTHMHMPVTLGYSACDTLYWWAMNHEMELNAFSRGRTAPSDGHDANLSVASQSHVSGKSFLTDARVEGAIFVGRELLRRTAIGALRDILTALIVRKDTSYSS